LSETAASLYQELVVERARRPLHAGDVEPADGAADGTNPLCGDKVHVTLSLGEADEVLLVRHRTRGCAICAASADLMAESVRGRTRPEARQLFGHFEQLLQQGQAALEPDTRAQLGLLNAFADLHDYRSRRKCATLPWSALLAALKSSEDA
jgi:nitrogen fixation NifU-like protein